MYKNQFEYDNDQEKNISLEEHIEEKQAQLADKIEKELLSDIEAATTAFINHLTIDELNNEDQIILHAIVEHVLLDRWENRNAPISRLVLSAINAQALIMAKKQFPPQ